MDGSHVFTFVWRMVNTDQIGLGLFSKSCDLSIWNIAIGTDVYFWLFLDGVHAFTTYC